MRFDIRGTNVDLGGNLDGYIRRRLTDALDRFEHRVRRVGVRLTDLNGSKGAVALRCSLIVEVEHAEAVLIEQVDKDLYVAVDRAASRAKRTVRRHIKKRRAAHRPPVHARAAYARGLPGAIAGVH